MRERHSILFLLCGLLIAIGCSGSDGGGTGPEPSAVDQGWAAFASGDYAGAKSKFDEAIADDATNAAAHNGLGWSNMMLDDLPTSIANFDAALANGFAGADPHAGKAIVLRDLEPVDYNAAISAANAALAIASDYKFEHDANLDWRDLRLILAQSCFALGQYTGANTQVAALGGTMQDSLSDTFVEDLLAEIERLGTLFGN